ncbi:MAG: Tad domain-containing protein [Thermoleophilia bacterium]|nr:Tad domain-containing protein [Gaiellaceae bacterium]MDW8338610.1 Tad domain-containing protein [Thermoleophilia bacterium]
MRTESREKGSARASLRDESGQVLVITGIAMIALLIAVGLVVDFGRAFVVQRQLQLGVDAAALAGAQHLPVGSEAVRVAHEYSPTPGSRNAVSLVDNAVTTVTPRCLRGVPGCSRRYGTYNALLVSAVSRVPTLLGRLAGVDELTVRARATACNPCAVKPLDIMIVLDRTGSMCQMTSPSNPNSVVWDANCTDLRNAREGVETFLGFLDPTIDKVGLAFTPPTVNASWISSCPPAYSGGDGPSRPGYKPWNGTTNPNVPPGHPERGYNGRYYGYESFHPYRDFQRLPNIPGTNSPDPRGSDPGEYVVAPLEGADLNPSDDYLIQGPDGEYVLNKPPFGPGTSALLQRLNCTSGAGSTSYALALEAAQAQLNANGRGNVQDIIIFLSDGAANTWPNKLPEGHWTNNWNLWGRRPCATGVEMARRIKASGTIIYTIGYDLDGGSNVPEQCRQPNTDGRQNSNNPRESGYDAYTAIRDIASSPEHFYNRPDPGQLNDIFRAIALDLSGSKSRLIDDLHPNLIG